MAPKKNVKVELEGSLTIQKAETIYSNMKDLEKDASQITFDFSQVTDIDFSVIQLLYSLRRTCLEKKKGLHMINIPSGIQEKIELCDFGSLIELK